MKVQILSLKQLVLGTVLGIGVVSLLQPPCLAQVRDRVNSLQDFDSEQNSDPFSSNNEADSFGVFDLIHRANMGNTRSLSDYSSEQNENLDAAAAEFRTMQKKRIPNPSQVSPTNSVSTPQLRN